MGIARNHLTVPCTDEERSAAFITELFGLAAPGDFGPFTSVDLADGVQLDDAQIGEGTVRPQHFAFLVTEDDFLEIYGRIIDAGLDHWADPMQSRPGEINRIDGGRGVDVPDPDGHLLEIITRPYGSG